MIIKLGKYNSAEELLIEKNCRVTGTCMLIGMETGGICNRVAVAWRRGDGDVNRYRGAYNRSPSRK